MSDEPEKPAAAPLPEPRDAIAEAVASASAASIRWAGQHPREFDHAARGRIVRLDGDAFAFLTTLDEAASLPAVGSKLLASVRHRDTDLLFVAELLGAEPVAGAAEVRLAVPQRLLPSSRRLAFRLDLTPAELAALDVQVWQIEPGIPVRDKPRASQQVNARIRDLSGGGTRMTLAPRGKAPLTTAVGQRLRIELTWQEQLMRFDGRVTSVDVLGEERRVGVQFRAAAHDIEMRRDFETLHRMLADMQRQAAKRRSVA